MTVTKHFSGIAVADHVGNRAGHKCEKPRETRGLTLLQVGPEGLEYIEKSPGKTALSEKGGAQSGAHRAENALDDPCLLALIEAWPALPESTKLAIKKLLPPRKESK